MYETLVQVAPLSMDLYTLVFSMAYNLFKLLFTETILALLFDAKGNAYCVNVGTALIALVDT